MSTPTPNKFTPEQEQWLQLLESGKFKQGTRRLKVVKPGEEPCYCCLGLACEFVLKYNETPSLNPTHINFSHGDYAWSSSILPDGTHEGGLWFYSTTGDIEGNRNNDDFWHAISGAGFTGCMTSDLTSYNDSGATFQQIAAAIRAVPWAVFKNFTHPNP